MQTLHALAASCLQSHQFFASTLREQWFELRNEDDIKKSKNLLATCACSGLSINTTCMHGPIQSHETVPQGGLGGFWTYIIQLWKAQTSSRNKQSLQWISFSLWTFLIRILVFDTHRTLFIVHVKMAFLKTIHLGSKGANSETKHSCVFSLQLWSKWKA